MAESTNQKVLPSKWHWVFIFLLTALATFSTISLPGGWILFLFPILLFFFGRGRQQGNEGLRQ